MFRKIEQLSDRMLRLLLPQLGAAAQTCWTESQCRSCGSGQLRTCTRGCCLPPTVGLQCSSWSCGSCQLFC